MSDTAHPSVLLRLAAEAVLPALAGCAEILGGGATTSRLVERGITHFGPLIAAKWHAWSHAQPDGARGAALAALAALSQEEARREAADVLGRLAADARRQDRVSAAAYLAAIPRTVDRLWRDDPTGAGSPATVSWDSPDELLSGLPEFAPPYAAPCDLPGTPYRLEQLLGVGGFGAVYRAAAASLQHLPLAVKFCLDPGLMEALQMERANLEQLMHAGRDAGSQRIVRLYGYDFSHATPYLVYEYVPGGDLNRHVSVRKRLIGRPLGPSEVLGIIRQVTEGLAFAHRHGLVHRDLKPANILVDGDLFKLADFGLGGVATVRAARGGGADAGIFRKEDPDPGRPGRPSRFRGAGTPLYMAPEQRLGAPPDPRHDVYSLGVMWHQMLADDLTRELRPGWAKELAVRLGQPRPHLKLIERCVGRIEDRPKDAGELRGLLAGLPEEEPAPPSSAQVTTPGEGPSAAAPRDGRPLERLVGLVRRRRRDADDVPPPTQLPAVVALPPEREECADLLRRLSQAHAGAARASARPGPRRVILAGLAAGGLAGWIGDELYYTIKYPQYGFFNLLGGGPFDGGSVLCGMAVGVAAYSAGVLGRELIWRRRLGQAQRRVTAGVHRLADRFPREVSAWGGAAVLHDAALVGRLLKLAEAKAPP